MIQFLSVFVPLLAAVFAWYFNERSKRAWEEYLRKEENYKQLLKTLRGFYISSADQGLKDAFLEQVNLCWLYCPDAVIQKTYAFLSAVHTDQRVVDQEKPHMSAEQAVGELVAEIRRDLLSRNIVKTTSLKGEDFKHLIST